VTWNVTASNPPIASGLAPETGTTLKIYNWPYYLAPSLMKSFEKKYGVKVELTTFADLEQGVSKVASGQTDFDMMFGLQIYDVGKLIASKLVQPVNQEYIPNFKANVWDSMQSPFYDVGSNFTIPYCIWNTGIMWRNDQISTDIAALPNPYDIFWNGAPKNKTHLLANPRDPIAMAIYHDGGTDVNTDDPAVIAKAKDSLMQIVTATNVQFDHNDYTDIPKGQAWLHQSWSGNVGSAFYFLPKGDTAPTVSYYWPGSTDGIPGSVDNDTVVVLKTAKNPVLAHLFIDWVLEADNALTNYTTYTGYQMPQKTIVPDTLVAQGYVPEHLATTVVTEDDFTKGYRICELAPEVDAMWAGAYQELKAGV
jgi:spermidine/putrescine transport system substrate-binding protein